MIGIDPTVDFACKAVLGSPEHPAVTLHFINAILGGDPFITNVDILNPIVEPAFEGDKLSILDILASDDLGRRFNIEVQRSLVAGLPQRLTYYTATQLVEQIGEGDSYLDLRPSINICILDAILFRNAPDLHLDFQLINQANALTLTDCLQIHLLELPKYYPPMDNELITDPIEQWAFFFRRASELTPDELTAKLPSPVFREATGILEMIARDPHQRRLYDQRLKMQMDEAARLQAATAEGEARGRAQGQAIGRVQLLQQLLGLQAPSPSELERKSLGDLSALEADLQRRLRERG